MVDCLKDELCTNSDDLLLMKDLKDMMCGHISVYKKNLEDDDAIEAHRLHSEAHRRNQDEERRNQDEERVFKRIRVE